MYIMYYHGPARVFPNFNLNVGTAKKILVLHLTVHVLRTTSNLGLQHGESNVIKYE